MIILYLILALGIIILLYIISPKWYLFRPKPGIPKPYRDELTRLGTLALQAGEVPIASILVFNNEIIGVGYNTVVNENNAGGHAEINAISDAFNNMGQKKFLELDRSKLIMYCTFEPCMMCQGAMQDYNIKHVIFIKSKPIQHWMRVKLNYYLYELRKKKSKKDDLQDGLFRQHPDYNKQYPSG